MRPAFRQRHAPVGKMAVVRFDVGDDRDGDEQAVPDEAHLPLDVALLVARIRVAEREGESVVGREGAEHVGGVERVGGLAADAGGVVEHEAQRHAPEILEHVLQALADAFGVLTGEQLRQSHVRIRERDDHEILPPAHAHDVKVGLAEINLGLAGMPRQREELGFLLAALALDLRHVMPDGRFARLASVLVTQPLVNLPAGVALLASIARVLFEVALDDAAVLVHDGSAACRSRRSGREVVLAEVFVHGVPGNAELLADCRDRLALPSHLSYRLCLGHADHFLPDLLAVETSQ